MDYGPLVSEEIAAGEDLIREVDKILPIATAFWLRASDEGQRFLYLASDELTDENAREMAAKKFRLVNGLRSPDLDPFRVRLIRSNDPRARAALELVERFPSLMPTRLGGSLFGGSMIDDLYLYATPRHQAAS